MVLALLTIVACTPAPTTRGVYRSGANAVAQGRRTGELWTWGAEGGRARVASEAPGGASFLGAAGPLWIFDRDVPAPPKATPVDATRVESAGFHLKALLPAATGVYVRSIVKVRQPSGPPVYVVTATGDAVGAGRFGGPADVRSGESCTAAIGLLDHTASGLLSGHALPGATSTCAVPVVVPPVDVDGDGRLDVLVHGQNGHAGFRAWFVLDQGTLVPGPAETWETIP